MKIKVIRGHILVNGKRAGTAKKALRFGYHPALHVKVKGKDRWFELDIPNLHEQVVNFTQEVYSAVLKNGGT